MAARNVDMFLIALICYASFMVGEEMDIMKENYILSSLWSTNIGKRNVFRIKNKSLFYIVVITWRYPSMPWTPRPELIFEATWCKNISSKCLKSTTEIKSA